MKEKKRYNVEVELVTIDFNVVAKNTTEAKKKALALLNRRKASAYIDRTWPEHQKKIYVDEI